MKLYYAPGACSLADHIGLREAGIPLELVKTDLKGRSTEDGNTIDQVNPKGYVPALVLEDGSLLTENTAILFYAAEQNPELVPDEAMGRLRLIEMLAFISSEVHKSFGPLFRPQGEDANTMALARLDKRFAHLAKKMKGSFLFGDRLSAADPYLYVMLRWAESFKVPVPAELSAYKAEMEKRPAVREALAAEGLS